MAKSYAETLLQNHLQVATTIRDEVREEIRWGPVLDYVIGGPIRSGNLITITGPDKAGKTIHETVKGAAGTVTIAASAAVTRAKDGFSALPGIQQLKSIGQDTESRINIEALKQASQQAQDDVTEYVPTIR